MEDEQGVRELGRRILERVGYRVLTARHGREALELCRRYEDPIHLLITDMIMPEMGGKELAENVAELLPDTRIILLSGYAGDTVLSESALSSDSDFLQKPFTVRSLSRKVKEVLDATA